jgi:hypothetical protein
MGSGLSGRQTAYVIVQVMVSIKEATAKAIAFARDALGTERTRGVRLEEVESTSVDGEDAWLITLSMMLSDSLDPAGNIVAVLAGTGKREYKSFTVLKSNGEVKSMKIRELADA